MADKGSLSDKERALIEAARRELAARTATSTSTTSTSTTPTQPSPARSQAQASTTTANAPPRIASPAPPADVPAPPQDKAAQQAARIAALMVAEREEIQRRRQKARRWGIYFPMAIFAAALLWLALRQFR